MQQNNRAIILWLASIFVVVLIIVFVGGVTRLTHSGLSMVDWRPLMGILPPLNNEQWLLTFQRYQQFPEYQLINEGMSLEAFKSIFFWEYFHRLLGRFVGMLFFFPWLYFVIKGKISKQFAGKIFGIFILGGLQGLMGWYMVKSGLVDDPYVSHYRLAAHLFLALLLLCVVFWVIGDLRDEGKTMLTHETEVSYKLRNFSWVIFGLICLQILYGAFTAGLNAGFSYNTFPKMDGNWIPKNFMELGPSWVNFFENIASVQFIHRTLGWLCVSSIIIFWFYAKKQKISLALSKRINFLILVVVGQFLLGVFTLLYRVPTILGSTHQLGACILLILSLSVAQYLTKCRDMNQGMSNL